MLDSLTTPQLSLTAAAAVLLVYAVFRSVNRKGNLPPGPRGWPILGNLLELPSDHLASYFRGLVERYGGLVSLNLVGNSVILIGDIKLAKEILEKRSTKHSSRPVVPYVRNHVDPHEDYWGVREQGPSHFIARKLTAGLMSDVRAGKTEPLQEFEARLNLVNLVADGGKNWFHHMSRVSASMVLAAAFGFHCPTGNEADLNEIIECIAEFVKLCTPSASIINALPFLDYIPGPMPWRTRAKAYRQREDALYDRLIEEAVSGKGSDMNTWSGVFARKDKPEGDQRRLMKQFTGAAIETTALSMQTFVLACLQYPDWIAAAQKEIDAVVGPDRLPTFKDRPYLPYVDAIVRETHRWRPAARFGVPHQSTEDDVVIYGGKEYFIPKGSIIFAVTWAMEHDQGRYGADHDRFRPARFLDGAGKLVGDYDTAAFGFGRRMCPGAPFAERAMWINIAMILWAFDVRKDAHWTYDDSDAAFSGDLSNAPHEFPAVFVPRSPQRVEVARREWAECEKDLNVLLPQPKEK